MFEPIIISPNQKKGVDDFFSFTDFLFRKFYKEEDRGAYSYYSEEYLCAGKLHYLIFGYLKNVGGWGNQALEQLFGSSEGIFEEKRTTKKVLEHKLNLLRECFVVKHEIEIGNGSTHFMEDEPF